MEFCYYLCQIVVMERAAFYFGKQGLAGRSCDRSKREIWRVYDCFNWSSISG